ncbi:MAG: hypothetical protein CTY25_12075 [Methylobacterium sp.]|nr:MAG: hypothetical protein CTY25_12075 [Methylobacterium sp.]
MTNVLKNKETKTEPKSAAYIARRYRKIIAHLIATWKGGSGKTKTAQLMSETALAAGWSLRVIDTDTSNKVGHGIADCYDGSEIHVLDPNDNVSDEGRTLLVEEFGRIFDEAANVTPENVEKPIHVIIDVAAEAAFKIIGILTIDGILDRLTAEGHEVNWIVPITGATSSHARITDYVAELSEGGPCEHYNMRGYIVLDPSNGANLSAAAADRSMAFNMSRDFPMWKGSAEERAVSASPRWEVVELPPLTSARAYLLYLAATGKSPMTLGEFRTATGEDMIPREQGAIQRWLARTGPVLRAMMERQTPKFLRQQQQPAPADVA